MLFKSATMTQASGSVGGITASHNKGGMYFRARSVPTNPNSPAQQAARLRLQTMSSRWVNTLTQLQRDAWDAYASQIPHVNALGDPVQLSGQQAYIGANVMLDQAGGTIVDEAPAFSAQPTFNVVYENSVADEYDVNIQASGNDWAGETGSFLLAYSSRGISPGRSYFKGPFRFDAALVGDTATPLTGVQTVTSSFVIGTGDKRFTRFVAVTVDGRYSVAELPAPITV